MQRWDDTPTTRAGQPPAPRPSEPDGTAARLWWRRLQAERDQALDWQRQAMVAQARVRELAALLEQQAALAGVRVRQAERVTAAAQRQRDWLLASAVAVAVGLAGVAVTVWLTGVRVVGGGQ